MARVMFDVLEINIAVTIIILLLYVFAEKLRKRYGARWLKLVWILLAFRLLIPYNFSLPFTEIRLFNSPGFAQEEVSKDDGNMPVVESASLQDVVGEDGSGAENWTVSEPQQGIMPEASGQTGESVGTDVVLNQEPIADANTSAKTGVVVDASPNQDTTEETLFEPNLSMGTASQQVQMNGDSTVMKTEQEQSYAVADGQTQERINDLTYTNILLTIWLVGVTVFAIYYISIYTSFQHKCKKSMVLLKDGELLEQVNGLQVDCLGKVCINVYQSELASTPMLVGFLVPKLVLPTNVKEWQQEELRMVVLHELCHYQQKDLWLKLIILTVHCLNWFNPALVLMKKQCFYDIELVCDMTVLEDCSFEERELYARTMLNFAKREKQIAAFSTNFSVSKKDLKNRINSMFDVSKKKRGFAAFLFVGALLVGMSLLISCGYKPEEQVGESSQQATGEDFNEAVGQNSKEANEQKTEEQNINNSGEEAQTTFDYNSEYNRILRAYDGITYLAKGDGVYQVAEEGDVCLFENNYGLLRDMEIYRDKLYFCGTVMRGEQLQNTIYYMDLHTMEVKDAMALFSSNFNVLSNIAIYGDKLYVLDEHNLKIGFELDESGMIVKQLDSDAEDYLYKDYNTYVSLQTERWNTEYDSAEWKELTNRMSDMYIPVMDVAECMELLEGKYIVRKYKDELYQSLYLVEETGEYKYLCDEVNNGTVLITTDGLYYPNNEGGDFSYVDFKTRNIQDIYTMAEAGEVFLVNYDVEYVYFGKSVWVDDGNTKEILMKIPRMGGTPEEVYVFEEGFTINSLCMYSGMDGKYMYFMDHERISLGSKDSLAEGVGVTVAPTKEEVLSMREKALEGMTEQEIERLKENIKVANQQMEKAYFYEDLFGKLADTEHLYWNYIDQKGDIQIGRELDGAPKMVYNRFDADNFIDLMEEMRDSLKNDLLKKDFDNLIENMELAKETHEVEYVEQIYRILHDMDYFLLRYGIEDVGKYMEDLSTVAKYYGVLEVYGGVNSEGVHNIAQNQEDTLPDAEQVSGGTGPLGMQRVLPEEVAVSPAIEEYTLDEALEVGDVVEFEGNLPGASIGTWYVITIDGVEHFYGKYGFYDTEMADYYGYAIFSEDYELANGIKVGMSQQEILEQYPHMRIEDFAGNCLSASEYKEATWWNGSAYPTSVLGIDPNFVYNGRNYDWLDQFDYVMIADIDLGTYETLPICLGLLMKDEKIKAITFYYPTAG